MADPRDRLPSLDPIALGIAHGTSGSGQIFRVLLSWKSLDPIDQSVLESKHQPLV